jgi:AcrR family transcriptional regulator
MQRTQRTQTEPTAEGLRERKKRLTRAAIFAAAARLFSERGFENVTVAEIADAANISVKTLFTYVRAKEELVFSDEPNILDALVAAVGKRAVGQSPLDVVTATLLAAVDDDTADTDGAGGAGRTALEGFHRMIGQSPAVRSRLRAMWDETEDALTSVLAQPGDGPRERADHRLTAAQLMVLVRTVTSEEVRATVARAAQAGPARDRSTAEREAQRAWIRQAADRLARGLQAAGR